MGIMDDDENHDDLGSRLNTPAVAQGPSDLTRSPQPDGSQHCAGCGGDYRYDVSVPSVVWNAVIRAHGLPEFLCLACIVTEFAARGRSFTATLWGGKEEFSALPIEVRVDNDVAKDAAVIGEENTALRAERTELLDALNCEPWHYVGTYDEEACFWCAAKRFSRATDETPHNAECPWARHSPHAAAVALRKDLEQF